MASAIVATAAPPAVHGPDRPGTAHRDEVGRLLAPVLRARASGPRGHLSLPLALWLARPRPGKRHPRPCAAGRPADRDGPRKGRAPRPRRPAPGAPWPGAVAGGGRTARRRCRPRPSPPGAGPPGPPRPPPAPPGSAADAPRPIPAGRPEEDHRPERREHREGRRDRRRPAVPGGRPSPAFSSTSLSVFFSAFLSAFFSALRRAVRRAGISRRPGEAAGIMRGRLHDLEKAFPILRRTGISALPLHLAAFPSSPGSQNGRHRRSAGGERRRAPRRTRSEG